MTSINLNTDRVEFGHVTDYGFDVIRNGADMGSPRTRQRAPQRSLRYSVTYKCADATELALVLNTWNGALGASVTTSFTTRADSIIGAAAFFGRVTKGPNVTPLSQAPFYSLSYEITIDKLI